MALPVTAIAAPARGNIGAGAVDENRAKPGAMIAGARDDVLAWTTPPWRTRRSASSPPGGSD